MSLKKDTLSDLERDADEKLRALNKMSAKNDSDNFITSNSDKLLTLTLERITDIIEWAYTKAVEDNLPELHLLFTMPNLDNGLLTGALGGGMTNEKYGVMSGFPDMFLPVARGTCHGLFIYADYVDVDTPLSRDKLYSATLLANAGYSYTYAKHQDDIKAKIERYILIGQFGLPSERAKEFDKKPNKKLVGKDAEAKKNSVEFWAKNKRKKGKKNENQTDAFGNEISGKEVLKRRQKLMGDY